MKTTKAAKAKKLLNTALDVLYPRRCPWCDAVLGFSTEECACGQQRKALVLQPGLLPRPRLPEAWVLTGAYAAYEYKEPVRDALLRMKFEDEPELAAVFGEALFRTFVQNDLAGHFDCLVPVPVSAGTLRRRGYNQSRLLADALAVRCGLPVEDLLQKVMETEAQHDLDREERLSNLGEAYAAGAATAGKRILLIDDIKTTGSTLNRCAQTLLAAGAVECAALCMAAVLDS